MKDTLKRFAFLIAASAVLFLFVAKDFKLQDDPVTSLVNPDKSVTELFKAFHEKSPFRGWIFIDHTGIEASDWNPIKETLTNQGYVQKNLIDFEKISQLDWASLAGLIPEEALKNLTAETTVKERAKKIAALISLPAASNILSTLESDPLGIGEYFMQSFSSKEPPSTKTLEAGSEIATFKSPEKLDYEKVRNLYDQLIRFGDKIHFTGGDFFSFENYDAVNKDIYLCMAITLPLNALLFWYFTKNLWLVGFLVLGTGFSYLTGLATVRIFYTEVYALVFAFTSTFVGFNNEYLVHLSGLDKERRRENIKGLSSAIGTTFIGFAIMLFSGSAIIRQTALASLGGMAGFILFLYLFRAFLEKARVASVPSPARIISNKFIYGLWIILCLMLAIIKWPSISTNIADFKYASPKLEADLVHFEGLSSRSAGFDTLSGLRVDERGIETLYQEYKKLAPQVSAMNHPMDSFIHPDIQDKNLKTSQPILADAIQSLERELNSLGVGIKLTRSIERKYEPVSAASFLTMISDATPFRWYIETSNRGFLIVSAPKFGKYSPELEFIPLSPKHYFDTVLTDFSRQMALIFAVGLLVMAIYLIPLQKSIVAVLYIFAPLLAFALALAAGLLGPSLNIIHFLGLSLVIAVTLDYTSIAHSNNHQPVEMGKILFTALSTIASFGVFVFARHPVLKDLGITVTLGVTIAFLFTFLIRLKTKEKQAVK